MLRARLSFSSILTFVIDPSEPSEKELLEARFESLEELHKRAQKYLSELDDPFQQTANLIKAAHAEKLYMYELQRRREEL